MVAQAHAGPSTQHRDQQGQPVGVDPAAGPAGRPIADRRDECLHLDEQRPRPFECRRHHATRRITVVFHQEGASGVGQLLEAQLAHLEHSDLLGRAEAVLRGAQEAQAGRPVALQRQHGVDQVLQGLGAGDRAVLGDVAHQHDRDPVALGQLHEAQGRLPDLAHAAGRPIELVHRGRLDGVNDEQRWVFSSGELHDPADFTLGDNPDALPRRSIEQAQARGPQANLDR